MSFRSPESSLFARFDRLSARDWMLHLGYQSREFFLPNTLDAYGLEYVPTLSARRMKEEPIPIPLAVAPSAFQPTEQIALGLHLLSQLYHQLELS